MKTKSNLRGALAILSTSCILNAHADMLPDPLGPLPKDVSRAVNANVTSAASPASAPIAKPTATPAPRSRTCSTGALACLIAGTKQWCTCRICDAVHCARASFDTGLHQSGHA